jgi:glycerol-3-phosphate cytidylyltransferase
MSIFEIGFTCGAFDLLHPGHLHFLVECSNKCDILWVGLHSNPQLDRPQKNKPLQSIFERYMQLYNLSFVEKIIPYDTEKDLENLLAIMDIHKRFVGTEYENMLLTGQDICIKRNIAIEYIPRLHSFSSTELRNRLKEIL